MLQHQHMPQVTSSMNNHHVSSHEPLKTMCHFFHHRITGNKQDWQLESSGNEPAENICLCIWKGLTTVEFLRQVVLSVKCLGCSILLVNAMCVFVVRILSIPQRKTCKHMNVQIYTCQKIGVPQRVHSSIGI